MIEIAKSETADTRTCDFANVSKETLLKQHIGDVCEALNFFVGKLRDAAVAHDPDKITDIDGFHRDCELLERAFQKTVELLKAQVRVAE